MPKLMGRSRARSLGLAPPAWTAAANVPWMITKAYMRAIMRIARNDDPELSRLMMAVVGLEEPDDDAPDDGKAPHALGAEKGDAIDGAYYAYRRGSVGVLPITGPIFHRANLFTEYSGATATTLLAKDFNMLLHDDDVKAIVLEVDSPGGTVAGTSEFANTIFAARGVKPIATYCPATLCSGAFHIGSASEEVIVHPSSVVGSVGVVQVLPSSYKRNGEEVIVSDKSPLKWKDAGSETGYREIKSTLNDLYEVMARDLSKFKGIKQAKVEADFGRGGVFVGDGARRAGMVDRLGDFESTIARYSGGRRAPRRARTGPDPAPESEGERSEAMPNLLRKKLVALLRDHTPAPARRGDKTRAGVKADPAPRRAATRPVPVAEADDDGLDDIDEESDEAAARLAPISAATIESNVIAGLREELETRDARIAERERKQFEARAGELAQEFAEASIEEERITPAEADEWSAMMAEAIVMDADTPIQGVKEGRVGFLERTMNARPQARRLKERITDRPIPADKLKETLEKAGAKTLNNNAAEYDPAAAAREQRRETLERNPGMRRGRERRSANGK